MAQNNIVVPYEQYSEMKEAADAKKAIGANCPTGSIVYTMDDGKKYMYSVLKETWYDM